MLIVHNITKILMYKSFKSHTTFNGLMSIKSSTPPFQNMMLIYADANPAV